MDTDGSCTVAEIHGCAMCGTETSESLRTLRENGFRTLVDACEKRGDDRVRQVLLSQQSAGYAPTVHRSCRQQITDSCRRRFSDPPHKISQVGSDETSGPNTRQLRLSVRAFHWKKKCFLCCEVVNYHSSFENSFHRVSTLDFHGIFLRHCEDRLQLMETDDWSLDVKGRLLSCCNLVAEEAVYHTYCYKRFTTGKSRDMCSHGSVTVMQNAFNSVCDWMEFSCENKPITLVDIQNRVSEYASSYLNPDDADCYETTYSLKYLKRKLVDRYGDHIFFAEIGGRKDVVCLRDMCSYIVNENWRSGQADNVPVAERSKQIVRSAAKLIATQSRETEYDTSHGVHPSSTDTTNDGTGFVPELLNAFLSTLIPCKLKQSFIGQAIVQAARPQSVVSPLLLELALDLDSDSGLRNGSRTLHDKLSRHGACVSYEETKQYKQSNLPSESTSSERFVFVFF